ncbi:MAG: hypothetical protein V3U30_05075 [Thermoplasmata archaeon]
MNEQVRRFVEAIQDIREDFKSIDVRVVAFRWNSQWVNLATRAVLSTRRPQKIRPEPAPPDLPDLRIDWVSLPMQRFDDFLEVFETGEFTLGETTINYKRIDQSAFGVPYSPYFRMYERGYSRDRMGIDTLSFVLSGGEGTIRPTLGHDGFEMLESKIASLEIPFEGVADLVRTYTGYGGLQQSDSYSHLELVAPLFLFLEPGCLLDSSRAVVRAFLRGGHDIDQASVGIIQKMGEEVIRRDREPLRVTGKIGRGHLQLETETSLDSQADRVIFLLSYRNIRTDRLTLYRNRVSGRNPRMGAFAAVDPGHSTFRTWLRGEGKKTGGGFEQAFLTLLTFLGFSCLHTGYSERNADILAWADDPSVVFVIECTVRDPDLRGKATKFAARLRHLDSVAPESKPVGIMATTLSSASVNPADLERLKTDGIILVHAEGLQEIVSLAEGGGSTGEALELLRNLARSQNIPYEKIF